VPDGRTQDDGPLPERRPGNAASANIRTAFALQADIDSRRSPMQAASL